MKTSNLLICAATAISLTACTATRREVPFRISASDPLTGQMARCDYSQYDHVRDTPTNLVYRAVLKAIPYTRHHAFWGHWAGSGCESGLPIDQMDEIFRRHDIIYGECRALRTMQWADAACVEALKKLDTRKMAPEAIAFRDRSISFFSNPRLTLVGKPVTSYFIAHEETGCPLQTEEAVRGVFGLKESADCIAAPQVQKKSTFNGRLLAGAKSKETRKPHAAPRPAVPPGCLLTGNPRSN